MKIGLLAVLATLIGGVSYSVASTNNKEAEDIETTVDVVTPHSVRVVYLPGNLCQVETDSEPNSEDLQGDVIIDSVSGDVGLLMRRYSLTKEESVDYLSLWVWDIYWIGSAIEKSDRIHMWTEYGLINIIKAGTFMHYKNN